MKVLFDCDVLLDVVLHRSPHHQASGALLDWAERKTGRALVAWHTIANLVYMTDGDVEGYLRDLLAFIEIPKTGANDLRYALSLRFTDVEDAMQVAAAVAGGADRIATRNGKDFKKSPVPAMKPADILRELEE